MRGNAKRGASWAFEARASLVEWATKERGALFSATQAGSSLMTSCARQSQSHHAATSQDIPETRAPRLGRWHLKGRWRGGGGAPFLFSDYVGKRRAKKKEATETLVPSVDKTLYLRSWSTFWKHRISVFREQRKQTRGCRPPITVVAFLPKLQELQLRHVGDKYIIHRPIHAVTVSLH